MPALCQPAAHLDEEEAVLASICSTCGSVDSSVQELHLARIAGLDIDEAALSRAKTATAPSSEPALTEEEEISGLRRCDLRWEPLEVQLWHGSLTVYNDELEKYEAIVCSEVIEHLPDDVLSQFGDAVLGRYRPRILVVTTPNYDFHDEFPAGEEGRSYPDPTGRTNRVFRHDDHQFEFTGSEFKEWCAELATKHRYHVSYAGVGDLATYKPNTASTGLCASQCAIFIDDSLPSSAARESLISMPTTPKDIVAISEQHQLYCQHIYPHYDAGPKPLEVIREAAALVLDRMDADRASVRELWARFVVSKSCAGSLTKLTEAIQASKNRSWYLELPNQQSGPASISLDDVQIVRT